MQNFCLISGEGHLQEDRQLHFIWFISISYAWHMVSVQQNCGINKHIKQPCEVNLLFSFCLFFKEILFIYF